MMNKENIIANGTEVYVFSRYGYETKPQTKGVIVRSKDSGDLSEHGSPWSEQVYEVLGEDGIKYFGVHGNNFLYDNYFRTKENYINYLNRLINHNNDEIDKLKEKNSELEQLIASENLTETIETGKRLVKKGIQWKKVN